MKLLTAYIIIQTMSEMTISEMNKHLEEMNKFFIQRTKQFRLQISEHQARFNSQDQKEFENLIDDIKANAMERITGFINDKLTLKCSVYDKQITSYTDDSTSVQSNLQKFRRQLQEATIKMKEEQSRKQNLMEHLSSKYCRNLILKKVMNIWKDYEQERKIARLKDSRMDALYAKNLLKKSFFPWRTLTYKDGHANTVRRETQKDISNIHDQYQSIISILKKKILETEDMIKVKKAAKGQFAYAMSKNLLKTISNLSLEVMSLNQMSLRDGEWNEDSTVKFMEEVDLVIKQKLSKVRQYRRGLIEDNLESNEEGQNRANQKKKKHISFA